MEANPDFKDLFKILNGCRVRYLVVGAHAVIYYTEPRFTKDLDIWVEPSPQNASRVWESLSQFGAPLNNIREADFRNTKLVYQIGVEPNRIDIMMGIPGVSFKTAWRNCVRTTYGGIHIKVMGLSDLIRSKRAAGRPEDLLDIKRLKIAHRT